MSTEDDIYQQFVTYPFSQDEAFRDGLKDLYAAMDGAELPEETLGQAKAFYFSRRTGKAMDWDQFLKWQKGQAESSSQPPTHNNSQSLSFQQIADLIRTGQTHLLPHNEKIAEQINVARAAQRIEADSEKETLGVTSCG